MNTCISKLFSKLFYKDPILEHIVIKNYYKQCDAIDNLMGYNPYIVAEDGEAECLFCCCLRHEGHYPKCPWYNLQKVRNES